MTDKELNSHNLAREIEISKLQKENEILKDNAEHNAKAVDKINWENMLLKKENQELKSQLRGTTHCFDEEEHNKLKEENQKLKKHLKIPKTCNLKTLEDYKSYYEDATREQILEDTYIEYCAYVNLAHRYSELKKQLENKYEKVGTLTGELLYEENTKLINQQKEFINYLEKEIKRINPNDLYIGELNLRLDDIKFTQYLIYKEILQKYKSIIGVSDEKEN